jgi:hypothetical protein
MRSGDCSSLTPGSKPSSERSSASTSPAAFFRKLNAALVAMR